MPKKFKPVRLGIKVFVNSEAKTGYVLAFQIHTPSQPDGDAIGPVHHVVCGAVHCIGFLWITFTQALLFFGPTAALPKLPEINRKNFPEVLKKRKLNVGDYHFATSGD